MHWVYRDAKDAEAVCKRAAKVTEKLISNGDSGFLSVKLDEKNTVSASKDKGAAVLQRIEDILSRRKKA